MPLVPMTAGQRLTATALNRALDIGRSAQQVGDQTVNNSVTLVDSNGLILSVEANAVYTVVCNIYYVSPTAADFKINFVYPTGASFRSTSWYLPVAESVANGSTTRDAADDIGAFGVGGIGTGMMTLRPTGRLTVGTTAGNFQAQFAQNTATVGNTSLKAGSWLYMTRVA